MKIHLLKSFVLTAMLVITGFFNINILGQCTPTTVLLETNVYQVTFTATTCTGWTVPANVTSMNIYCLGGGGGGGGAQYTNYFAAGGGGGASAVFYNYTSFTAGTTSLAITVGAGGTGASAANGGAGGASEVKNGAASICRAVGGNGGAKSTGSASAAGAGGAAASCTPTTYAYSGGNGGNGGGGGAQGGGGGGAASYAENGKNANASAGGRGGKGVYFSGGTGATGANVGGYVGVNATGYGGGGSGATSDSPTYRGGNGATGVVVIIYTVTVMRHTLAVPAAAAADVSSSWTVPSGVSSVTVECWGAGGGGGSATTYLNVGGGGGGGAYTKATGVDVTVSPTVAYIIGKGGAAVTAGGLTKFNNTVTANGGSPGADNVNGSAAGGAGGTAGTYAGGAGANGLKSGLYGGGGGASAGISAAGTAGSTVNGAAAGATSGGGSGGNGVVDATVPVGYSGVVPGGGGGGAYKYGSGTNSTGGTGGHGQIVITYTVCSTPSPTASSPQTFCGSATVANLTATGTAIKWYSASSGGSALTTGTALSTGNYYASQTVSGCESTRTAVAVTVNTPSTTDLSTGDWLFTGAVSAVYENPANWSVWNGSSFSVPVGVPQVSNNVRIKPIGTCILNSPVVSNTMDAGWGDGLSVGANCNSMVIEAGAVLTMHPSNNPHFHVFTSLTNNGTIVTGTGRVKFVGAVSSLTSSNATETFYEMNLNEPAITTMNCNVTVTNGLRLRGVAVMANGKILHVSNSNENAIFDFDGHVWGTLRRSIVSNTGNYVFPVGVGNVKGGDARLLRFLNNNISGVSYLDCSVSNSFKGSGQNIDAMLDPAKAKHYGQTFTSVSGDAEWSLIPNTSPSGGSYGVRLYLKNFSPLTDNNFSILKRSDASTSFYDYNSFFLTAPIPATASAGRIYDGGNGYAEKNGFTSFSKFVVASSPVPLPVSLTRFSADCGNNGDVILNWSTASEQNSEKFTVEKSSDLNTWSLVENVAAAGNSSSTIDYQAVYADSYRGISYYRLVQVDYNGLKEIFDPISVSCSNLTNDISVYPNPSNGKFTVEISSKEPKSDVQFQVTDLSGKIVSARTETLVAGVNQIMYELEELKKGVYIIVVKSEGEETYKPVKVLVE